MPVREEIWGDRERDLAGAGRDLGGDRGGDASSATGVPLLTVPTVVITEIPPLTAAGACSVKDTCCVAPAVTVTSSLAS